MEVERKLRELGYELPEPAKPVASYIPYIQVGDLLFLSGHGPVKDGKPTATGKVGREITEEQAYKIAEEVALNCLATAKAALGDLDKIERIIKLTGYVASDETFNRQPWVINGASELLIKVLGEKGRHTRTAVGVNKLPLDIPVEIEMIIQVKRGED